MARFIYIMYSEIDGVRGGEASDLPSLSDVISTQPQDHEEEIAQYLDNAPNFCALGKVVGDALDPSAKAILVPGTNTDGLYLWPTELAYYVRRYHLRLPRKFVERMASLNWNPPAEASIDWKTLDAALATPVGVPENVPSYHGDVYPEDILKP